MILDWKKLKVNINCKHLSQNTVSDLLVLCLTYINRLISHCMSERKRENQHDIFFQNLAVVNSL